MFLNKKLNDVIFLMTEQQSLQFCHVYLDRYHCQLAKLFRQLILFLKSTNSWNFFSFNACACVVASHNRVYTLNPKENLQLLL